MKWRLVLGLLAASLIATALVRLGVAPEGTRTTSLALDGVPVTVYRSVAPSAGPVVVIAHGFAGSQQLMQSFALAFARNGYTAVTFDFPGHGRNPHPMTGDLTRVDGATRTLMAALGRVATYARPLGDGRLVVLGHSMASDIVIRYAADDPTVVATIAVSMYSPAVTATAPRNLLVIVGDWESSLKREALRAVGLAAGPATAPGITYGDLARGSARRAAFSAHVEHASVLFSQDSQSEALAWVDGVAGRVRARPPLLDSRGPWILLLIAGVALLAWPLSTALPRVAATPLGASLGWRRLWLPLLIPMIITPLVLRWLPTHFLPVLVGDYLAVHFAVYGCLTLACLRAIGAGLPALRARAWRPWALGVGGMVAFSVIGLFWPLDSYVTSFVPGAGRGVLLLAMLIGTAPYFVADEWLTRGPGAGRGAYLATKTAFIASLGAAVALDFERLFFLIIIVPVMVLFFLVYGLFSAWAFRRTGDPLVAGLANGVAFAWAISVSFPLLAG